MQNSNKGNQNRKKIKGLKYRVLYCVLQPLVFAQIFVLIINLKYLCNGKRCINNPFNS